MAMLPAPGSCRSGLKAAEGARTPFTPRERVRRGLRECLWEGGRPRLGVQLREQHEGSAGGQPQQAAASSLPVDHLEATSPSSPPSLPAQAVEHGHMLSRGSSRTCWGLLQGPGGVQGGDSEPRSISATQAGRRTKLRSGGRTSPPGVCSRGGSQCLGSWLGGHPTPRSVPSTLLAPGSVLGCGSVTLWHLHSGGQQARGAS